MRTIAFFFLTAVILSLSCAKWEDPATSIVSTDKSIATLLLSPSVYTMQEVRVIGKVWKISETADPQGQMTFVLADSDGNYIKVISGEEPDFAEQDIVRAAGLFDSNYISSESRFDPTLRAKKIEVIKRK